MAAIPSPNSEAIDALKSNDADRLSSALSSEGIDILSSDLFYTAAKHGTPLTYPSLYEHGLLPASTPSFTRYNEDTFLAGVVASDNVPLLTHILQTYYPTSAINSTALSDLIIALGKSDKFYPPLSGVISIPAAEALLKAGLELTNSFALHSAAQKGRIELIRYLVSKGADLDEVPVCDEGTGYVVRKGFGSKQSAEGEKPVNRNGTPLHWAVEASRLDSVKELLDLGANPNETNEEGVSLVRWSRWRVGGGGKIWDELVQELRGRGFNADDD